MNALLTRPLKNRMTPRRVQILEFIRESIGVKGFPPSIREIGEEVGLLSSSTVHRHLRILEQFGHIKRDPSKPRSIVVTGMERVDRHTVAVSLLRDWAGSWPDLPAKELHDRTAAFLEGA